MVERIVFSGLELRFRHGKDETGGSLDLFEMTVQPKPAMPIAHRHASWDGRLRPRRVPWQVAGVSALTGAPMYAREASGTTGVPVPALS